MEKDKNALTARVAQLEQTAADHERRVADLEARLDPKTREQATAAALDDLLDELAGLNDEKGKEGTTCRK